MNNISLILIYLQMLFAIATATCQQTTQYPNGGYATLRELQEKKPSGRQPYNITAREEKELTKNGGNDYKAEVQDTISMKWRKENKLYAISYDGTLYLNGASLKLPQGFINVIEEGPFLFFQCATPRAQKQFVVGLGTGEVIVGGAVVKVIDDAKHIRNKMNYCLEIATGETAILDKVYLTNKLQKYPDLFAEFNDDPYNTEMDVLLKYFRLMNAK